MKIVRIKNTKLFPQGYKAITIGPFVFTKPTTKLDPIDLNHEAIHWEQEKEMFVIFFYIWYVLEYLIKVIVKFSFSEAYKDISFEKEAYLNEENLTYIENRKHYKWFKLI